MNHKTRLVRLEQRRCSSYVITEEHRQAIIDAAFGGLSPEEVEVEIEYILADWEACKQKMKTLQFKP